MSSSKGFTLIELVIVIVLISVIAAMVGLMLNQGFLNYSTAKPITTLAGKGNVAADNLMRELKSAQSISAIAATSLTYTNQAGQQIVINLSGSTLQRNVNGGGDQALCAGVSSLSFEYYNAAFDSTATPASVLFVTLAMTVTDGAASYSLMTATTLRALL